MELIENNPILEFRPNTVETLRKKYNMDDGRLEQSIGLLRDWINKQRHFVSHDFDRDYLERCIFSCKGSVEKAKRQTDRLCTLRTLVPKYFLSEDLRKHLKELFDVVCIVVSQKQTKDYKRVMLVKLTDKEFTADVLMNYYRYKIIAVLGEIAIILATLDSELNPSDSGTLRLLPNGSGLNAASALCEYLKSHDYSDGYIAILDFREANLLQIIKELNPVDVQQILTVMIEGYGAKIKGIHMVSHSKVIEILIKAIKPFLSQKIANRIHVHQENEELYSIIDRDILPLEYGGKERSLYELNEMWLDELSSPKFESYVAKMASMSTNESFRLAEKFNEDCVGLPGSFRTLSVD